MEGKIKTALERALERSQSFGDVAPEELEKMEYMPRGRSIGASFMNKESFDIKQALAEVPEGIEKYVLEGLQEVLLLNIALPADEAAGLTNQKAMNGLAAIKRDKSRMAEVTGEMDYLLKYYRQALDQTMEKFKKDFEARSRMMRSQVRGRDQERIQGFREEWASVLKQLNDNFENNLAQLKDRIRSIG